MMIYVVVAVLIVAAVGYYWWSKNKTTTTTSNEQNFEDEVEGDPYSEPIEVRHPDYSPLGTVFVAKHKNKNKAIDIGKTQATIEFEKPIDDTSIQISGALDDLEVTFIDDNRKEFLTCKRNGTNLVVNDNEIRHIFNEEGKNLLHISCTQDKILVNKECLISTLAKKSISALKLSSTKPIKDVLVTHFGLL